ncbi:MAG: hypothetical protein WED10_00150 [Brumimicrobium sp.]
MKTEENTTRKEYDKVMSKIEVLLQKATELGGFKNLSKSERSKLSQLSVMAEQFEDGISLMPVKATKSLADI